MQTAFLESAIPLSLRVRKGKIDQTGLDVDVRVIDTATGAELLATTTVPESSDPGLYYLSWDHTENTEKEVEATFSINSMSVCVDKVSRLIRLIKKSSLSGAGPEGPLRVKVIAENVVKVRIAENPVVNIKVLPVNVIKVRVLPNEVVRVKGLNQGVIKLKVRECE